MMHYYLYQGRIRYNMKIETKESTFTKENFSVEPFLG